MSVPARLRLPEVGESMVMRPWLGIVVLSCASEATLAQYKAISLHRIGAVWSEASGIHRGQQTGAIDGRAGYWTARPEAS